MVIIRDGGPDSITHQRRRFPLNWKRKALRNEIERVEGIGLGWTTGQAVDTVPRLAENEGGSFEGAGEWKRGVDRGDKILFLIR